ncbi:MAG TPA: alpha-mannosidase, partial [Anaerolineae bacterium]|nr:alpha-mannosidase [Anaerolineae bacterium]
QMSVHWLIKNKIKDRFARLEERVYTHRQPVAALTAWFNEEYVAPDALDLNGFRPFQIGEAWGHHRERGYFHLHFTLPADFAGERALLLINSGGEGLCYRDGVPWQGVDWAHPELLLADPAQGGESFDLIVEAAPARSYWDHNWHAVTFEQAEIATVNQSLQSFLLDATLLYELAEQLPEDTHRAQAIYHALDQAADCFDYDGDDTTLAAQAEKAHAVISPLLEQAGPKDRFTVNLLPNSHIDVMWLWPYSETLRKSARTFATATRYMELYPEYIFVQSQPQLYELIQQHFPTLYERIKARVQGDRLEPVGAMWVEADTNIPSGESLVRQILLGNRFFEREFGKRTRILWLPDVFGYSGAIPQILKLADIPYFMTTKLNANEDDRFPYNWFWWEGIDGSRVLSHIPPHGYGGEINPQMILEVEQKFQQKGELNTSLRPWGWGDGGGGPEARSIERLRRLADVNGLPRCESRPAEAYFDQVAKQIGELPVWRGEIYFENHRGTYTTQAAIKWLNRWAELLLREAEMLAVFTRSDTTPFRDWWKTVCLHQFHDILPGSSITQVYQETRAALSELVDQVEAYIQSALARLSERASGGEGILVWNALPWSRADVVILPDELSRVTSLTDVSGRPVPLQPTEQGTLALVNNVPSLGYTRLTPWPEPLTVENPFQISADEREISNGLIRLRLNDAGQLTSVYDLRVERELLPDGAVGNEIRLHEDMPAPGVYGGNNDAWDIHAFYRRKYRTLTAERIEVVETGPVRAAWRLHFRFGQSHLTQDIYVYTHTARVDFHTEVDWHESQKMLRVYFPADLNAERATYEIQFGALERPTHFNTSWDRSRFEVPGHKWADLSEADYGLALLNDSKYGYAIHHSVLSLTLLRATTAPDPQADRGHHTFTYAILPHPGDYRGGGVVQEGYALNVGLRSISTPGSGQEAVARSFITVESDHVVLETVKPAEDGDAVILRFYESQNRRGRVTIAGPFQSVAECNLMEEPREDVLVQNGRFSFEVRPFEIKSFRCELAAL